MLSLDDFKKKLNQLKELFSRHGLTSVEVYKGFGSPHNSYFNIIVTDVLSSDSILNGPDVNQIKNELSDLLNCGVLATTESQIQPQYLSMIRAPKGSVKLFDSSADIDSSTLADQLDAFFGKDWIFKDQQQMLDEQFLEEKQSGFHSNPFSQIQEHRDLYADSGADLSELCEAVRHFLATVPEAKKDVAIAQIGQVLQEAKPSVKPFHT